jgi:riboflavin kinase/FMN adenylyltransferase
MLGNFDGLHAGHKRLFAALEEKKAQGLKTVVFSFFPHPASFLTGTPFKYIYTPEEKIYLLKKMGADAYIEYPFGEVVNLPPERFIADILVEKLNCLFVAVGENYRFGQNRAGGADTLIAGGAKYGFDVKPVPLLLTESGVKVSSSSIREHILSARFDKASELLTRPYFIRAAVESGEKIGRSLGFPTVNQSIDALKLAPPNGVYSVFVHINGETYKGAANVGVKPTVSSDSAADSIADRIVTAETFIIGFNEYIYGEVIEVDFLKKLRDERKFPDLDALKAQIALDIARI